MVVVAVVLPVTIRMICEVMGFSFFLFTFSIEFPSKLMLRCLFLHGKVCLVCGIAIELSPHFRGCLVPFLRTSLLFIVF